MLVRDNHLFLLANVLPQSHDNLLNDNTPYDGDDDDDDGDDDYDDDGGGDDDGDDNYYAC